MWINGINYKSLNFTLMKDKLLDGSKTQTGRTTFIPKYGIGETIAICFNKIFLFLAKVINLYPKQIKDYILKEAKLDGFNSVKEFQDTMMEINNIKSKNHWSFLTVFKKLKNVLDYLEEQ